LPELIGALAHDFGAVAVQPVHPKPAGPAIRLLMRAVKGARTPLTLLPALMLNGEDGRPAAEAEAVLRGAATLPLAQIT